jgi:hypothetical protein
MVYAFDRIGSPPVLFATLGISITCFFHHSPSKSCEGVK